MVITSIFLDLNMRVVLGIQQISPEAPRIISYVTVPRRPFYITKSSTSHIIPLHPIIFFTIMSIAPGLIKVNNRPILFAVLHHSTKVSVPLFNNARLFIVVASVIHSLMSIKCNINGHHKKSYGDSIETHFP